MKLKEMIEQAIKVLESPYPWQVVQYLRDVFIENLSYMYELDLNIYLECRHIGDGENIKSKILPRVGDKIYLEDQYDIDWYDYYCAWGLVKSVSYDLKANAILLDLQAEEIHEIE